MILTKKPLEPDIEKALDLWASFLKEKHKQVQELIDCIKESKSRRGMKKHRDIIE